MNPSTPTETVMISALEHWSYCPRQCALIHLEATFSDNVFTVRGKHAHERAHEPGEATEAGVRIARGMTLWSDSLGLSGKADTVEFHGEQPYPVEYKVGKPGPWIAAELQLGAQAMCLEEMLNVDVPVGAVFYWGTRRRTEVRVDESLRRQVRDAVIQTRAMLAEGVMPPPVNDRRCPRCSLVDTCLPAAVARPRRIRLMSTELFKPDGWYGGADEGR